MYVLVDGIDLYQFQQNLKNNKGTCICSIDYANKDMKCMCKEFKENSKLGDICHCGIFQKIK